MSAADIGRSPAGTGSRAVAAAAGGWQVAVVCNDPAMREESRLAARLYAGRPPTTVRTYRATGTDELAAVFAGGADLVHYVGHVADGGFVCRDGALDAASLDRVGAAVAVLNACGSREQGERLVAAGADAGVVTRASVVHSGAKRVGAAVAWLLGRGAAVGTAAALARTASVCGDQYAVVGDGTARPAGSLP